MPAFFKWFSLYGEANKSNKYITHNLVIKCCAHYPQPQISTTLLHMTYNLKFAPSNICKCFFTHWFFLGGMMVNMEALQCNSNVSNYLSDDTVSHPRTLESSATPVWTPQISYIKSVSHNKCGYIYDLLLYKTFPV